MANPPLKTWRLLPRDQVAAGSLAQSLQVSPLIAQLLLNRGVGVADEARRFLDAPLSGLHSPELLPGVTDAADRLWAAVQAGRRICIYGDYDVDGVTGTTILIRMLRAINATVDFYVPHRLLEGYGINVEALRHIAANKAEIVVTVDCGIASIDEADEARQLGLELIVTDHHEMKETLPNAAVLVHPRLPGTSYPFGGLCGAGVAFKLAWALAMRKSGGEKVGEALRDVLLDGVAFAALGVIADVVPLHDENRIIVRYGLNRLKTNPPLGIQAICEAAGLTSGADIKASDIGFRIGPRINAAGRLGEAMIAVDLLTTTRRERAVDLARRLELLNEDRQKLERAAVLLAKGMIQEQKQQDAPALVLASAEWHGGIVGIVAGRLAEQFGRPTLMITLPKPGEAASEHARLATGSGRSIPGLALHEALAKCTDLLVGHGGHAAAAGFRLLPENVDAFRQRFCESVSKNFPTGAPVPEIVLDDEAPLSVLTVGLLKDLDKLEPYGAENRRPVFLAGNLRVQGEPKKVGQGERHLSFRVGQSAFALKAIAWNMADRVEELMSAGGACCVAFTPRRNEWQGRVSVDLEVVDFQPGAEARLL